MVFSRFAAPLLALSLSLVPTYALPQAPSASSLTAPLPLQTINTLPVGAAVENLAVRRNGLILTTSSNSPTVFQVNPFQSVRPSLVAEIPGIIGTFGIAELYTDIFYVAAGNVSNTTFAGVQGSWGLWEIDLTEYSPSNSSSAKITKAADLPGAQLLNGVAVLSKSQGEVLVSDSDLGLVWKVDTRTGTVTTAIQDPLMAKSPNPDVLPFGINGIKIRDGFLYWSNTGLQLIARVPINRDGSAAGSSTTVASGIISVDDFEFDIFGNVFVAANDPTDTLDYVKRGQSSAYQLAQVAGITAVQFGRTSNDSTTLYITHSGSKTVGGGVLKAQVGVPGPQQFW